MVRSLLRSWLRHLLHEPSDVSTVQVDTSDDEVVLAVGDPTDGDGGGLSEDTGVSDDAAAISGTPAGVIEVSRDSVNRRKAAFAKLFKDHRIPPDMCTVLALRDLHDDIVKHNMATGWLLDRRPHSRSTH